MKNNKDLPKKAEKRPPKIIKIKPIDENCPKLPKHNKNNTIIVLTRVLTRTVKNKPVLLDFDGGHLSSDAGLLILREVEQQIGIIQKFAETIHDPRDSRYVKHDVVELLTQRIFQIAAGYEDANDCDALRNDPIIKLCADRLPEADNDLASQPTEPL